MQYLASVTNQTLVILPCDQNFQEQYIFHRSCIQLSSKDLWRFVGKSSLRTFRHGWLDLYRGSDRYWIHFPCSDSNYSRNLDSSLQCYFDIYTIPIQNMVKYCSILFCNLCYKEIIWLIGIVVHIWSIERGPIQRKIDRTFDERTNVSVPILPM